MANSLGLPNNLYTGDNYGLDISPFINFYMGLQARKQARDEALDKYYQDFTKSISPAGMRNQDIQGGWMQKVNDWRNFYVQNAAKIKNPKLDNGQSYNEYMSRYQDILNDTERSKQAAQSTAKLFPILSDPDKRDRLTDYSMLKLSHADRSIYDPEHEQLSPIDVDYNPKPLTDNDFASFNKNIWANLKPSDKPLEIETDPKTKSKVVVKTTDYDNSALGQAAHNAESLYQLHGDFHNYINQLASNEDNYNKLNSVFKKYYGHDLDAKHGEEIAAAWALSNKPAPVVTRSEKQFNPTTIKIDTGAAKADAKANDIGLSIDNYIEQLKANSIPQTYKYAGSNKSETHYQVQPNPELADALAVGSGSNKRLPEQIQFLPNGDVLPVFYKIIVDKSGNASYAMNGNNAAVDKSITKPISANEFRIRVAKSLLGQTGVAAEMKLQAKGRNTTQKVTSEYTNITETNKGTIGVKNGKWYNIKTGKPIE